MNKVLEKENKERNIQIYRSSKKMFSEAKIAKIILYCVNFIPLILVFTQDMFVKDAVTANLVKFTSSAVSLILNVLTELLSNIIANHKEKAVLLAQLFETEITGTTLSKMEYDREITNDLYEIAIRKGTLKKQKQFTGAYDVPQEIDDKYAYLFINRYIAAENRFILDKLQILFGVLITVVSIAFVFWLSNMNMAEAVYYLVCFWSVFIPIVRNFAKCSKNKKQCVKISADIDNFFADGDDSSDRLQRFNFYVQSLSFEMRNNLVTIPKFMRVLFGYQIKVLDVGVTNRFIEAIYQFENTVLEKKGQKASRRKFEWISRENKGSSKRDKNLILKAKKDNAKPATATAKKEIAATPAPKAATATPKPATPKPAAPAKTATRPKSAAAIPAETKKAQAKKTANKPKEKPATKIAKAAQKPTAKTAVTPKTTAAKKSGSATKKSISKK